MAALILPFWISASGCGGGGSGSTSTSSSTVTGVVIDGPVSGATVTVTDSSGRTVGSTTTGDDAKYSVNVPAGTTYPLRVAISGGTDQVTGEAPAPMESLVTDSKQTTANVTPITTVMVQAAVSNAGSLDKVTPAIVTDARNNAISNFGFGVDSEDGNFDPIAGKVGTNNITSIIRSSEAMAEIVRRAVGSNQTTVAQAIKVIGEDMADGSMDGKKNGAALSSTMPTGFDGPMMVSTVTQQKVAVGMEVVNNNMKVTKADGTQFSVDDVKTRMSRAVNKVEPSVPMITALSKMEAMPVSEKQKNQVMADMGNVKKAQEVLGESTTVIASLETAVKNLEAGKTGVGKVDSSVVTNAMGMVNTFTSNVKNKQYAPTALSASVSLMGGSASSMTIMGVVIDGPVTGATVTITDSSDKNVLGKATTGADARYVITVPSGSSFPLHVSTSGGTDQVTGQTAAAMDSIVVDAKQVIANVTPVTTVMYQAAVANAGGLGKVTAKTISDVKASVVAKFGFGIDAEDGNLDPVSSPVRAANVASVVKSSEAMMETVRRAVGPGQTTVTQSLKAIGEDMADGSMDGARSGVALTNAMPTGFSSTSLVAAVMQQKAVVGMETANNSMKVTKSDGSQFSADDAKTQLSKALNTLEPSVVASAALTKMAAVPVSQSQKGQMAADIGDAIKVQTALGTSTANMVSLQSAVGGLESGKAGAGKVSTAVMESAAGVVKTVSEGIKKNTFTPAAINSAFASVAPSASTNLVTGTMSAGAMINTNVVVTVKDREGDSAACTSLQAVFTCDLDKIKTPNPPYFIKVVGKAANKEYTLYSVAHQKGQANVNPMTNLVVANTIGADPGTVFNALGSTSVVDKVAKIDTAAKLGAKVTEFKGAFLKTLEDQGYVGAQVDPFTATIEQGKGLDKVFDGMQITLTSAGGYQVVDKIKLATAGKAKATVLSGNVATLDVTRTTIDTSRVTPGSKDFTSPAVKKQLAKPLAVGKKASVVDNKTKKGVVSKAAAKATTKRSALWNRSLRTASADEMALINPVSAYFMDEADVFVNDRVGDALKSINEGLCAFGQVRYDVMLNQGPYKAQVDMSKCSSDKNDPAKVGKGSKNKTSGAGAPDFEDWIVDSQRESDDAPQIVKFWVRDDGKGSLGEDSSETALAYGYAEITEGASSDNPYGVFKLNVKDVALTRKGSPVNEERGRISLDVGQSEDGRVKVTYLDQHKVDGNPVTDKVVLVRSGDGNVGSGSVSFTESVWDETAKKVKPKTNSLNFAFDENWFLRQGDNGEGKVCLSRNEFVTDVVSYGLYHLSPPKAGSVRTWTSGDRVDLDSGFPISMTDAKNNAVHGWVGYFGTWFPEDVPLTNGVSVKKEEFVRGGEDGVATVKETAYTVFQAGGKLVKHSWEALTLADVKNIPLQYTEWDMTSGSETDYMVEWNGTGFVRKSKLNPTSWFFEKVDKETALDLNALESDSLWFFSESLGGDVRVRLDDCVNSKKSQWAEVAALNSAGNAAGAKAKEEAILADKTPETWSCKASDKTVAGYAREYVVQPGTDDAKSVPAGLLCGDSCPNPEKLAATDGSSPFQTDKEMAVDKAATDVEQNFYAFTFDKDAMVLKYGRAGIVSTVSNSAFPYGIQSGPLFENTKANLEALKCDGDKGLICPWQAWDRLDVFYTWETGPNDWNKLTALKDSSGSFLKFDPPLQVTYSHQWSGDVTTRYSLKYEGPGDLQGIPGRCVGRGGSDDEVSCGPDARMIPDFSIADGTVVEDKDGNTYLVRALELEERMLKDDSGCTDLALEKPEAPSEVSWIGDKDPATRLGDVGSLTGLSQTPAVIGGEQQAE